MSFKVAFRKLVPPWLLGTRGVQMLNTFGSVLDDLFADAKTGIKARFPDYAPDDALGYIGNDRQILRGPSEGVANYKTRLNGAIDAHRNRGGARTLLSQLAGHFSGQGTPPLRLVSNSAVWHEYNYGTGATTRTDVGTNWNWDGLTARWWRGWVIIDSSAGPFGPPLTFGAGGGTFGDGATFGSDATKQQVQQVQRVVQRWKPANVYVARIIVTFDSSMFERTDASPPNPDGDFDDPANWPDDACFWLGGGEEP